MRLRLVPLALLAALALVATVGAGTSAAKSCGVKSSDYPGSGYFTSLTVKGVTCSKGKKVARAHYRKRLDNGGKDGEFEGRVKRFRCGESSRNKTSTELNARVTCERGSKRIKFTYQQNL